MSRPRIRGKSHFNHKCLDKLLFHRFEESFSLICAENLETHYVDVAAQVNAMGAEERAIPILEHVLKNHKVTNGDVQKMLGVSKPTATRLLQKLDAVLELVGHGVGSYYRIRNY